jgi:4-hydroxybenzoate-CoA ligase
MTQKPEGAWEDALRDFLRGKLPGFKVPRWFEVVNELPKTPTGKIQRFKLRAKSSG